MYTALVVDDEQELRQAIIESVDWEKAGFRVVGDAGNGIDALELAEKLEPDLILTDIKMPMMTGLELAKQVRELRPATQVVILSGYDDFGYAKAAIEYNIIGYLLKPSLRTSARKWTSTSRRCAGRSRTSCPRRGSRSPSSFCRFFSETARTRRVRRY